MYTNFFRCLLVFCFVYISVLSAQVQDIKTIKKEIGVKERIGHVVTLKDIKFTDQNKQITTLNTLILKNHPILIVPVYYSCPHLCTLTLNGLLDALNENTSYKVGQEFTIIAVSMNPEETAVLAQKKQMHYLEKLEYNDKDKKLAKQYWYFLTGNKKAIDVLFQEIGFSYKKMEKEYAHTSVTVVLNHKFKIMRYLYGIKHEPINFKMSLLEAKKNIISKASQQILFFCFQYDPKKNSYVLVGWKVMLMGCLFFALLVGMLLSALWILEKRKLSDKST